MTELGPESWLLLGGAALLVGFAKTSVGGVASISVAVFAAVLPARESTGALLPLLLVGDLVAVWAYRTHADRATLIRLLPAVVVGVVAGVVFVGEVGDTAMRRTIGVVLLLLVVVHLWQRRHGSAPGSSRPRTASYGALAGFTTMVANSGGAVMSLYLLSARLSVLGFLGTTAWFFLLVNLFKLPFSVGLGLVTPSSLALDAAVAPLVLVGAWVGRRVVARLDRSRFESFVVVVTVLSCVPLLR